MLNEGTEYPDQSEAEALIEYEIVKEKRELKELGAVNGQQKR